jgi:hypothetical protein
MLVFGDVCDLISWKRAVAEGRDEPVDDGSVRQRLYPAKGGSRQSITDIWIAVIRQASYRSHFHQGFPFSIV